MMLIPFFDCRQHVGVVDLNANTLGVAGINKVFKQRTIAAAEVEYPVAGGYPAGNDGKIRAAKGVRHSLMFRR